MGPFEQNITMTNGFKFVEPVAESSVTELRASIKKAIGQKRLTLHNAPVLFNKYEPYKLRK